MRRSRVLVQTAAGCALVFTLAGCGSDNPKPAPAPTKSASSSLTGEVAPTMPAEARGTSEAAAKAFVKHYLDVFSYASRTGEVDALQMLAAPDCNSCNAVVKALDKIYGSGGRIVGRGYTLTDVEVEPATSGIRLRIALVVWPSTTYASSTAKADRAQKFTTPAVFDLGREANAWRVSDWRRLVS